MGEIERALSESARSVTKVLNGLMPEQTAPERQLIDAMRYATLGGGKRLRPFLVISAAQLFGVAEDRALRVGAAVEMVHCYSLVHDDLPAMDDDELRRGMPTCHVKFGEAAAILAGDALLTMAFEVLADEPTHTDARVRALLVLELARAVGAHGMVGGQMLDLVAGHHDLDMPEVARLQRLKTGMMIGFACESGAILAKAPDEARHALHNFAHDLGLAFQIADDLLDAEGDEREMGKKARKDGEAGKATFVSLMGVERARTQARMIAEQAVNHLDPFDHRADPLRQITEFVVERRA